MASAYIDIVTIDTTTDPPNLPATTATLRYYDPNSADSQAGYLYNLKKQSAQWLPNRSVEFWNCYGSGVTGFEEGVVICSVSKENTSFGEAFAPSETAASVAVLFDANAIPAGPPSTLPAAGDYGVLALSRMWYFSPLIKPQVIPNRKGGVFTGNVVGSLNAASAPIAFYVRDSTSGDWLFQSSQVPLHTGYFSVWIPAAEEILAILYPAGTDVGALGSIPGDLQTPVTVQTTWQGQLSVPQPAQAVTLGNNSLTSSPFSIPAPAAGGSMNVTVEAWVRPGSAKSATFLSLSSGPAAGQPDSSVCQVSLTWLYAENVGGVPSGDLVLRVGNPAGQIRQMTVAGALSLGDNSWHHVAAVLEGDSAFILLDGRALRATTNAGPDPGTNPLINSGFLNLFRSGSYIAGIGVADTGLVSSDFAGDADEVRIWTCARRRAQITGCMYRSLTASETGLAAYWSFEGVNPLNSPLGSLNAPLPSLIPPAPPARPVTYTGDTVAFTPLLQPYVVAQCKLMLDPMASTPGPSGTDIDTYRVTIRVLTGEATPMPFAALTLYPERDNVRYFDNQAEKTLSSSGNTFTANATGEFSLAFYTDSAVSLTGELPLRAPLLKVTTAFMAPGDGLLISPDRHLHYGLVNLTADKIQSVLAIPGNTGSIAAMTSAVNQLAAACVELDLQSNHPVLRNPGNLEDSATSQTAPRLYESALISRSGYDPFSDVSTSALHQGLMTDPATAPVRVASVESMPLSGWSLALDGASNTWAFTPSTSAAILNQISESGTVTTKSEASQELFSRIFPGGRQFNSVVTMPRETMLGALNLGLGRGTSPELFSLSGLVNSLKEDYDDVKAAVITVVDDVSSVSYQVVAVVVSVGDEIVGQAIAAVDDVLDLASALLKKAGVNPDDIINAIKAAFNWANVINTKEVFASVMALIQQTLIGTLDQANAAAQASIATSRNKLHSGLQRASKYFAANGQTMVLATQSADQTQPPSTEAGLIQSLASTYLPQATSTASPDSGTLTPDQKSTLEGYAETFKSEHENIAQQAKSKLHGQHGIASLATDATELVNIALSKLADAMNSIVDLACDTLASAANLLCEALEDVLNAMADVWNAPLNIPVISSLYNKYVDPGNDLTIGNLLLLFGAVPVTVIYAALHNGEGPFSAADVKVIQKMDAGDFIALAHRANQQKKTGTPQALVTEPSVTTFDIVNRVVWALDYFGLFVYAAQILAVTLSDGASFVGGLTEGVSVIPIEALLIIKAVQVATIVGTQLLFAPLTWFYDLNQGTASGAEILYGTIWLWQWIIPFMEFLNLQAIAIGGALAAKTFLEWLDSAVSVFYFFHGAIQGGGYFALILVQGLQDEGLVLATDMLNSLGGLSASVIEMFQLCRLANLAEDAGPEMMAIAGLPIAADVLFGSAAFYLWFAGAITGTVAAWEA